MKGTTELFGPALIRNLDKFNFQIVVWNVVEKLPVSQTPSHPTPHSALPRPYPDRDKISEVKRSMKWKAK